jgi:hypothetical protein
MLIALFGMEGIVHSKFVVRNQSVDSTFYEEILRRFGEAVRRKGPQQWRDDWLLRHDNAP